MSIMDNTVQGRILWEEGWWSKSYFWNANTVIIQKDVQNRS